MERLKLIIPTNFRDQVSELDFLIIKEEEYQIEESCYHLDLSELIMNPTTQQILGLLSILAIPSSIDGLLNLIERIKRYCSCENNSQSIIIVFQNRRYTLKKDVSEDTYKELKEYIKKLADEGRFEW